LHRGGNSGGDAAEQFLAAELFITDPGRAPNQQNRQLNILICNSQEYVDDFVRELTF